MKKSLLITASLLAAVLLGVLLGRGWSVDEPSSEVQDGVEREVLYWKAPMDPNYRRDEPGKSPMGMDLVPVYKGEGEGADPALVSIDPSIVSNLGVRTAPADQGPLSRRIDTVGYVSFDEETVRHIHTRVDGWIENLTIMASGDAVSQGQVLFELYSPTLVNAQEEYLAALVSRNNALQRASRDRLAALGVTAAQIKRLDAERTVNQRIRVYAESDGVVAHLGIRDGMYVTPAIELMSIADLGRVWLQVDVFERQSAWVEAGQRAEVQLDYLPGERWQGSVDYVYPELDPKTRTLKVRLRFENPKTILRPNMFASVTIFGTPTDDVVHVPREALIRGGSVDRVVVSLGDGRFRSQKVTPGIESGERVAIRAGLSLGDRVVVSGQFLIDSESNIGSALTRFEEPDTAGAMDHSNQADSDEHDAMDHSTPAEGESE